MHQLLLNLVEVAELLVEALQLAFTLFLLLCDPIQLLIQQWTFVKLSVEPSRRLQERHFEFPIFYAFSN